MTFPVWRQDLARGSRHLIPAGLAQASDELVLLAALAEAVDNAMYGQPPDEVDRAPTDVAVPEALLPLAQRRGSGARGPGGGRQLLRWIVSSTCNGLMFMAARSR